MIEPLFTVSLCLVCIAFYRRALRHDTQRDFEDRINH